MTPPTLLLMGIGGSMLWWDEEFCRMLAGGGRFVVRYDHRGTGRSTTYDPGHPPYNGADLVADAAGVLDAYGLAAAHIVGVSAGGAFAQLLAIDFADRVLSLVLIGTSPATPGDRGLPPPTEEFGHLVATAEVDWSDPESVIEIPGRLLPCTRRCPARLRRGCFPCVRSARHRTCPQRCRAAEPRRHCGRRSIMRTPDLDRGSDVGDPRHG